MSEEKYQIQEGGSPNMATFVTWESQLQARANEMLQRRARELKAEVERLQGAITEIGLRLAQQDDAIINEESSGLIEQVKRWFDDRAAKFEEEFKPRLEEAAANARREAEIEIEEMRGQLESSRKALTEATEQLEASRNALASASSLQTSPQSFDMFRTAIEDIDSQRSQSDTLAALVRQAAQFAPRVVFFVIKSGDAVGWKACGFDNGLNDETVKQLVAPAQKPELLRDALINLRVAVSHPQSTGSADVSDALGPYGSPAPERAIAIPLIVLNKAVAVLYADSGARSGDSLNIAAAESLTRVAGRTIEFLLSRRAAEAARPGAKAAGGPETPPATPLKADGKAMGAAIQQTPADLAVQPGAQMDSSHVESELKQDSVREIRREIREGEPKTEKTTEAVSDLAFRITGETPKIEKLPERVSNKLDRVTIERRRTQELPDSQEDDRADEGLRQAEAQLPEPAHIETEPGLAPEPRMGFGASSEIAAGVSGKLRFESLDAQPAPSEAEQHTSLGAPLGAPPLPLSDFAPPPVEAPPASSEITSFSAPPAPPIFISPAKPLKSAQPVASVPGSETEQRAHNDARRFARLLVSEIKLYNAAKVNDGRRNYDLYDRLKDEIDRSRKVYDKRVAPTVAARFDYFYDELVQTLAEGDPAKLGKDCPGPVALA